MSTHKPVERFTPGQERFGTSLIKRIGSLQTLVYELTGGRVWNTFRGGQVAILTVIGRKSGQSRKTPLLYIEDGDRLVVIASNAGDEKDPAWWLNLQAQPHASVQVRRQRFDVVARRADPAETERLWPRLVAAYSYLGRYREKTQRDIPVILLERSPVA